jgi:hypothetical protein
MRGPTKAVYFKGHRLADLRLPFPGHCGVFSPRHWECTKVKNHKGPHVAHCTDETTGLPDEIMDEWADESSASPPAHATEST